MTKKKKEAPVQIKLTQKEADATLARVRSLMITEEDAVIIVAVFTMLFWIQQQLSRAKLSIKRLKNLFGFKSESLDQSQKTDDANTDDTPGSDDNNSPDNTNPEDLDTTTKKRAPTFNPDANHGRLGVDDYTGCNEVDVPLGAKFDNRTCPHCLESNTIAKLNVLSKPRVIVVLHGTPLVAGIKYSLQQARCSVCEAYFKAPLPKSNLPGGNLLDRDLPDNTLSDDKKIEKRYTPSVTTGIIVYHYSGGLPFKRIETLQSKQGIPLPDATQWDLVNGCYKAVIQVIMQALRKCAANGDMLRYDDTGGRILEKKPGKKTAHATAMLVEYEDQRIALYDTSELTAGKELEKLLGARDVDETFTTMSDASSSNFPPLEENLFARWIICLCLAHSRRRFKELLTNNVNEITFILKVIGMIYHHDHHSRSMNMTPEQRLRYHQEHSAPLMDALRIYLNNLLLYKTVEPNSELGDAIIYLLKHWQGLTQFLRVADAPLDNNLCEQAIKIFIRYRKNSWFYRSFYGATVGDAMMSVLQTAAHAGVNQFDYFNTLQEHEQAVNADPFAWLPWNYQKTLAAMTKNNDAIAA